MEYRVVEIDPPVSARGAQEVEIARFESAYHAAAFVSSFWYRGDARAGRLHVLDYDGSVLLTPYDLVNIGSGAWS